MGDGLAQPGSQPVLWPSSLRAVVALIRPRFRRASCSGPIRSSAILTRTSRLRRRVGLQCAGRELHPSGVAGPDAVGVLHVLEIPRQRGRTQHLGERLRQLLGKISATSTTWRLRNQSTRPTSRIASFSAMCTNFRLAKAGSMAAGVNGVVNASHRRLANLRDRDLERGIPADGSTASNQNPFRRGPECERCWRLP